MASLSRQLARWVTGLRYDDLPDAVVDRAKGFTLHALTSALLGSHIREGRQAVALILDEEAGVTRGATIMVDGARVTRGGAAYANSEMVMAGGKWDTFRMLTHPGTSIVPAAFVAAETAGASGRDFITGLVAGYEVSERMAADFIPTVMARGFHAGIVFGIFGAAVAAAKILGSSEDQVHSTIAACASLAAANLESARSGGQGMREGAAARNALLAVALARHGYRGGETVLEGEAGFYHAYAGNNHGRLTHSFVGDTRASLEAITAGLGTQWLFLETLYRIYSTAGYNIAHVDVTAALCAEQNIRCEDVERIETVVNWLETQYPSPAFPSRREDLESGPGSTAYFAAYGVVKRGFPLLRRPDPTGAGDPPEVLDLMKRVTLIPSHTMTLFGPCVTIITKDGRRHTKQGTGREFIWDFDEEARRIREVVPGLPIPAARFEEIIATCRDLDRQSRADALIRLTLDDVKEQVAAHWDRRAPTFDDDFGHSIRTPGERAAWDRILDLVVPTGGPLDALDAGCGTGFLAFELAGRGHRVTGVDFAPTMLAEARRKAQASGAAVRFEQGDVERLPFPAGSFDLVISRHVLWTLPHPEAALDEWMRLLRPGGCLVVVDGQFDATALVAPAGSARSSAEYAAVGDRLPFLGGRSREEIEALLAAHGLADVRSDPLHDLVAAQEQRMVAEGRERRTHRRYVVWGYVRNAFMAVTSAGVPPKR